MKTYINRFAILLAIAALSACKVSKDIPKPVADVPTNFRDDNVKDTSSIADIQWRSFFTDVTLQKLIDSAMVKNFDMQIALKNIEAAQLQFKQVKWEYVPSVDLNVTANSNRPSDNSVTGLSLAQYNIGAKHIEDYNANLSVSWEADIWGKIRSQQKSALATYLQTAEARKVIQTDLVAGVSQGYYNLLMLDEQLNIAKSNLRLTDSTLRIVRLQFDAGQVTSLAVDQTLAQKQAAEQLIPQFEQNVTIQENALSILTGHLPDAITRDVTLSQINVPDALSAGVPSEAVSRRPDVKQHELALVIANANVGINKAEMYPALRITAQGGINSFKATNWFNIPASLFGVVAGSVLQPLFDHKELRTQYDIAKVQRERTVLEFRQSVLTAVGEVSDALVKVNKLKEQEVIANNRVSTLKHATANSNMLFKNGLATYLEVITAQSNVLQSELDLATIKNAQLSAVSELYRALGGGWKQ